jgi:alkylated DNA repair dioxygenase AlkB
MNLEYLNHPALKEVKPLVEQIHKDLDQKKAELLDLQHMMNADLNRVLSEVTALRNDIASIASERNMIQQTGYEVSNLRTFCQNLFERLDLGRSGGCQNPVYRP